MSRLRRRMGRLAAGVLALAAFEGTGAALAQQMPAMPVTVANPVSRKITESVEFTGRFQAWPQVNITSRVTGYLDKSSFVEGSLVKEGDVLFAIDPRPFQAAVDQAAAQVKITQTRIDLTKANLARAEALKKTGNVTDAAYQANLQAYQEAAASIDSASAALATAKLDLSYATITAPISGRITRQLVSRGNLVVANSTSPLVSIVAVDPIYFYFDLDEASYLAYQRASKRKIDAGGTEPALKAEIGLSDERKLSHQGTLDYLAPQVDAQTGTVTARAKVANADGFLTPGLFGRIRITIGEPYDALVVPDVAVGQSSQGRYVIVVGADKIANIRPVELGPKFGSFRVIKSGLKPEDQVLINGQMRARPGGEVVPQPTKLDVPETLVPDQT
ncbi:efflux RND transporter periplasmic adaptor subunit [Labrys neptuniae]|uniref:efflux RND transporter periplasmic adaptor subunit n=1 Tax=Labrys TaxID=204476 RepID=UPI00288F9F1B|nr:efflux RND transporter periplasmic adaptor subunit [Labrys neptuniae]MDT3378697.1 efflux RND transporter periplasmic adaptor subunit [Labrys neptuniae]